MSAKKFYKFLFISANKLLILDLGFFPIMKNKENILELFLIEYF